jgi:hypothetical protein
MEDCFMMTPIATRFVDWDIPELSTLQDSKVYQLRVQLNEGTPMSRQQKNWLTDSVNSNTYFKRAVPLMGYRFDFSDILKRYFVKQYGHIAEYYAVDKTALRTFLCSRIDEIIEITD